MVSYRERKPGSYTLTVSMGRRADGTQNRKHKTIKVEEKMSPKKLKAYLEAEWYKFEMEVLTGAYISPEKLRFKDLAEKWKENFAKSNYAETTYVAHISRLNSQILPIFKDMYVDKITPMMINDFLANAKREDGQPLSVSSRQGLYKSLSAIFKSAAKWKVLKDNPMDGVDKPKNARQKSNSLDVYNPEEIKSVIEALSKEPLEKQLMFSLTLFMGLRRSELLALEWKHINLNERVLSIEQAIVKGEKNSIVKDPKSHSSNRTLGIPDFMVEQFKQYRERWERCRKVLSGQINSSREWLFFNMEGEHLYPDTVTKYWKRFTEDYGLRYIKLHDLRHTNASILLAQGSNPKELAAALGHADTRISLEVYARNFRGAEHRSASRISSFVDSLGDLQDDDCK